MLKSYRKCIWKNLLIIYKMESNNDLNKMKITILCIIQSWGLKFFNKLNISLSNKRIKVTFFTIKADLFIIDMKRILVLFNYNVFCFSRKEFHNFAQFRIHHFFQIKNWFYLLSVYFTWKLFKIMIFLFITLYCLRRL